jgi:putative ABC transport system permease protein
MFGYYFRLALASFRRSPGLTALMVLAIAAGISVCVITLTMYHAMSGNPIWWKSDRVYAVTIDSYSPTEPADKAHPSFPPDQLTYRDATWLLQTTIPERKVVMYKSSAVISSGDGPRAGSSPPVEVLTRVTSADFFKMFEAPFKYGSGWNPSADTAQEPVIVLSHTMNQKLFGGQNSVGKTVRWNDRELRVVGVLDDWEPQPKYYDLNNGPFDSTESAYVPWSWSKVEEFRSVGNSDCWKPENIETYQGYITSECVWVQGWVELPDAGTRVRMQTLLDSYWDHEHKAGRLPRPRNNRLTTVDQWLVDQDVVQSDDRVLVGLAFAFLTVCLINTVGLLLAKFLNGASISGVRRALGASRRALFMQHMVEVGVVALAGALLGLGFGALGLHGIQSLFATDAALDRAGIQGLAHVDVTSVITAFVLAIVATFAAGLYPAWRIGRIEPASYLKNQ